MGHPEDAVDADYSRAVMAFVGAVGARGIPLTPYDSRTISEYTYWVAVIGGMPAPGSLEGDESDAGAGRSGVGRYVEVEGRFQRNYVGLTTSTIGEIVDCSSVPPYIGRIALGGLLYAGNRDPLALTEVMPDAILEIGGFVGRNTTAARVLLRYVEGVVDLPALSEILDAFRLTELADRYDGAPFKTTVALGPPHLMAVASFVLDGQLVYGSEES